MKAKRIMRKNMKDEKNAKEKIFKLRKEKEIGKKNKNEKK